MKICLISYYGPFDTIKRAIDSLNLIENVTVCDFPLFKYMHDINDKVDNYEELLINYINENRIEYILWWFINIPTNIFMDIKNKTKTKYIFFNWDEPYNWNGCDIPNKMKYINYSFITCEETTKDYINNGTEISKCLYPGFHIEDFYKLNIDIENYNKYSCDISFCCTNLYENEIEYPNQYINRKVLIDSIYENQSKYCYTFHIYGPEFLKQKYPNSYKGFARYNDLNKIFNYSKINLCTHVLSNKGGYLNERIILIGASGGLVLMDNIKDIETVFIPNKEIVLLDKDNYLKQIKDIIENYDLYLDIRNNIYNKCVEKYNYNIWANTIINTIKKNN